MKEILKFVEVLLAQAEKDVQDAEAISYNGDY